MSSSQDIPIGIFDSGIGGLSVVRAIRQLLPHQSLLYLGDQAHVPYGIRPLAEVRDFSRSVTRFLLDQGVKLVVVACNTASAASLRTLREEFPHIPFVGMEPAVKPAAEQTHTGVVGVLATYATFQTEVYASVVERFARGVTVLQDHCPGLVAEIEKGNLEGAETRSILERALLPMLEKNIDTVVMGCTHYPFVIPLIQQITGPGVRVIDPAPAIARQTRRLLEANHLLAPDDNDPTAVFYTTGPREGMAHLLPILLQEQHPILQACWQGNQLKIKE